MKKKFIKGFLVTSIMATILGGTVTAQKEVVLCKGEPTGLTAGVTTVTMGYLNSKVELNDVSYIKPTEVINNEVETVTDSYKSETLYEKGTKLYAITNVNIRSGASSESSWLGTLTKGNSFILDDDLGNGWLKFTYKDVEAYVSSDYVSTEPPMIQVSSTAYWDKYNRRSASGRNLRPQHSVAGMVSWLGKSINVYECNADGSIGKLRGTYTFDDTGYGAESGYGQSKILKGRTVGTIENGTCIDFYFNTDSECVNYGRQSIYIQFVD